jgi:hypothetical protein
MPTPSRPHDPAWARVKSALQRDWDQTRHDLGLASGQDLRQDLSDTVKQAAGTEPMPARHVANAAEWTDEAAVRFGYGAAQSPNYRDRGAWNDALEASLRAEWDALHGDLPWADVRLAARYGWTRSKRDGQT